MNLTYGRHIYDSIFVESMIDGWGGYELYRSTEGKRVRVARVAFWDATGEFVIETFLGDIPLTIAEELAREARENIKIR